MKTPRLLIAVLLAVCATNANPPVSAAVSENKEQSRIVVMGDVKIPRRILTESPRTLSEVIEEAGGFSDFADTHNVTITPGDPSSLIRMTVVDAEQIIESGMDYSIGIGTTVHVPRMRILFPDSDGYQQKIRRFPLSAAEARNRALEFAGSEETIPEAPGCVAGDYFVFTETPRRFRLNGYFVNGFTGKVKPVENGKIIRVTK